jgi:2-dehydropantoate 2-reductase
MPDATFEFAILGAGAIGSIIGAHLARAGHAVVMLARGARADTLQARGLSIRGLSEFTIPVPVLRDPRSLKGAANLIVATKTPGTSAALAALAHASFDLTFSIQNGPQKDELLARAFGRERVLGALADTSGELLPDGDVLFTRNVSIYVGELGGGLSERAQRLARTIDAAGVACSASAHIETLEWSKFCAWAGLMALSVITRAATWKFLSDPDAALLLVRLVREVGTLAQAMGIGLSDEAVLPVARLCTLGESAAAETIMKMGADYRERAPAHRMSALQDLEAGRPLEVNETLGYACEQARARGLELPLLECCTSLVRAIDRMRTASPARAS